MVSKIAIIIYGPPGAGKGTQANLLADHLGGIHFDTGRYLEEYVHDPKNQKSKIVQREKKLFDSGKLLTPSFVLNIVKNKTKEIARANFSIIYSGSPRTIYEAKGLLPILEKLYGKKNIFVFILKVPPEVSIKRNSNRLVCSICGYTLLSHYYPIKNPKICPVCAGKFYRRTLDNPEVIKVRLKEYENRTKPIFDLTKKRKYKVKEINGTPAPYKVFQKNLEIIKENV
ncbi:nucleoside monophosphate kinase [Patescibacteria group bacterium]|nr:nucleoside monophosphate kinase [Patescibacteria group bacterium]MCL5733478.1 nucleoside monophosphate kinase [Patescibacteria group bacterium]